MSNTLATWSAYASIAGVAVTLIGFALTVWQLTRTATATNATRLAIERTEKRMVFNHVLVLLPQFRLLEIDLDAAASDNDRKSAIRALVAFAHIASEVSGLLRSQEAPEALLADQLSSCAQRASLTKGRIIDNPTKHVKSVTKDFRSELAGMTTELGGLLGNLASRTEHT